MMRGQLFSLDALLALLLVTLAIGLMVTQTESFYYNSSNELQTMASDWSQIAVKKTLVSDVFESNNLSSLKLSTVLQPELNNVFVGTTYDYVVELYGNSPVPITSISSVKGCTVAKQVSIIRRPAMIDSQQGYLLMKVCKNE